MSLSLILIYFLVGAVVGLIGGMLGLGGGLISVPILYALFTWQQFPADMIMHITVATSLATVITVAIVSTYSHHKRQAVLWQIVGQLTPGIVVGASLGVWFFYHLSSEFLRICFAIFEILIAIQVGLNLIPKQTHSPKPIIMALMGLVIGMVSVLVGIGGGTMTIPLLLYYQFNMRHAVATSSACGLPIALVGTSLMIISGWGYTGLPHTLGFVYLPATLTMMLSILVTAPMGAKIAHQLPVKALKRVFAILLLVIGIRMLMS